MRSEDPIEFATGLFLLDLLFYDGGHTNYFSDMEDMFPNYENEQYYKTGDTAVIVIDTFLFGMLDDANAPENWKNYYNGVTDHRPTSEEFPQDTCAAFLDGLEKAASDPQVKKVIWSQKHTIFRIAPAVYRKQRFRFMIRSMTLKPSAASWMSFTKTGRCRKQRDLLQFQQTTKFIFTLSFAVSFTIRPERGTVPSFQDHQMI